MSIEELWSQHMARRFPPGTRERDDGPDLVMLDADIAGCVSAFLESGVLDDWRESVLTKCADELTVVLATLSGEALEYFEHLGVMAQAVMAAQNEQATKD